MILSDKKIAHALERANKRPQREADFLAHWARIIVVSLALFVVIRAFGVEAFKIASGSREHTLFEGDSCSSTSLSTGREFRASAASSRQSILPSRGRRRIHLPRRSRG